MHLKAERLLQLANRARQLAIGAGAVDAACRKNSACLIFVAENAGASVNRDAQRYAEHTCVIWADSQQSLGALVNRKAVAILAVLDQHFAAGIKTYFDDDACN